MYQDQNSNVLFYNEQPISQREDGYVNLSQMSKANNVRLDKWLANDSTIKYLEALVQTIYPEKGVNANLIDIRGFGGNKATWGHPLAAIAFAQWISPSFHVWCNMHIKTLIETGKTELIEQPKLTYGQQAVQKAHEIRDITDTLEDNPRLAQLLIDHALLDIRALPYELQESSLVGVVELAHQLGFKTDQCSRIKLGNFIARQGFEKFREKRICNGSLREINCYRDSSELREAIKNYFER